MTDATGLPRSVLMTADAVGGVWHYALGLCQALPQIRFMLAVIGPAPGPAQREAAARLGNVTVEHRPYRLEWMQGGAEDLRASRRWLSGLTRSHGADLIHVNGYAHAVIDCRAPILAAAHSDVLSWWQAVHGTAAPGEWDPYCRAVMAGLRAADCVVAPTAAVLADLRYHYGPPRDRVVVIPNGIDPARFAPGPKRPVIMAAGRRWDEAKNLAMLEAIAADLEWPIEIAGDPRHPDEPGTPTLPSPACGGGLPVTPCPASGGGLGWGTRGARLLGPLNPADMAARLASAEIFAAPARYEPFGLAILEAAASGCALVLGDIPSLRENWAAAALFAPPDDPAAWRNALAGLIADPKRREALAAAARRRAAAFSLEAMGRRYAGLYQNLFKNPLSPAVREREFHGAAE